jgi:hypothetical protein
MEDLGKLSLTVINASGIKQVHREKVESKETMDKMKARGEKKFPKK